MASGIAPPRRCCVVCFEEPSHGEGGITCSGDPEHLVCSDCLEPLVKTKVEAIMATGSGDASCPGEAGLIFCPCRGLTGRDRCTAVSPFADRDLAQAVSAETFAMYLDGRSAAKLAEVERRAYADAHEMMQEEMKAMKAVANATSAHGSRLLAAALKRSMPDARMCPECGHGPMDHRDCEDLAAHHGQVLESGARIDNACPKCGFFSRDKADWPLWDGTLANDGNEAVVDAATTRQLVEAEVREVQEQKERAELRAEAAVRSRKAAEAHARGLRSSMLESVNVETQRRKKEQALRKHAEAQAAEERSRREALETAFGQHQQLSPAPLLLAPLRTTLGKSVGRPVPGNGQGIPRPISAPSRRAKLAPISQQPTGGEEEAADDWQSDLCHRPRPISAPGTLRPASVNDVAMGVGSLKAALREARREAGARQ